jgi:hypothetical protein
MGREGFEPSTLGLRVHPNEPQKGTRNGNVLQIWLSLIAASCNEMLPAEPSLYAQAYARGERLDAILRG